jgi:hypothetical protein
LDYGLAMAKLVIEKKEGNKKEEEGNKKEESNKREEGNSNNNSNNNNNNNFYYKPTLKFIGLEKQLFKERQNTLFKCTEDFNQNYSNEINQKKISETVLSPTVYGLSLKRLEYIIKGNDRILD